MSIPDVIVFLVNIYTFYFEAGFGLGALNDADEDDLDVYDSALSTRNNGLPNSRRVAYHHDEADDDDRIAMGRSRRPDQRSRIEERAGSRASGSQTFSDGRPVLKGFVLSDRPVVEDKWCDYVPLSIYCP